MLISSNFASREINRLAPAYDTEALVYALCGWGTAIEGYFWEIILISIVLDAWLLGFSQPLEIVFELADCLGLKFIDIV